MAGTISKTTSYVNINFGNLILSAALGAENARLQQQLAAARKDSSTSAKPPSSDIVKPKKPLPKGGKKRQKGGQPGHDQHEGVRSIYCQD